MRRILVGAWHRYSARRYEHITRGVPDIRFEYQTLRSEGYYSQRGQDKWIVEKLLPGLRGGVFVDIGAHDGVSFSNTYYLEDVLGWTGLAVEPIPEVYAKLRSARRCTVVQGCAGGRQRNVRFLRVEGYAEMLSGIVDQYDPRHSDRVRREIAQHGGASKEILVECHSINALLERHGLYRIDYMSLDIEGGELDLLRSLDLMRFDVRVIGIENNYRDYRIPAFLSRKGYRFNSVVGDQFFLKV
jgi:FkbM family methyltransferase